VGVGVTVAVVVGEGIKCVSLSHIFEASVGNLVFDAFKELCSNWDCRIGNSLVPLIAHVSLSQR
jgi:hypothetical protein